MPISDPQATSPRVLGVRQVQPATTASAVAVAHRDERPVILQIEQPHMRPECPTPDLHHQ
jgi:hypothetical protein